MNIIAKVDAIIADTTPVKAERPEAQEPETPDTTVVEEPTGHDHKPVQHRDGKERWCNTCGLTADGSEPTSRLDRTGE